MSNRNHNQTTIGEYVPPNSVENEQATLGAMLIERRAIDKARDIVTKGDFYRPTHETIFDVICFLADNDKPVDLRTVQDELVNRCKLESIGGMSYLTSLFETVPTAVNVEWYAKIVQEKSLLRQMIAANLESIGLCRGEIEDIRATLAACHDAVLNVNVDRTDDRGPATMREIMPAVFSEIESAGDEDQPRLTGMETGWEELDQLTGGYQDDDYVIICGDRGSGKTWTALWTIEHCALRVGKGVYHVSQEMSRMRVGRRALATMSGVPTQIFRTGRMDEGRWGAVAAGIDQLYTDLWLVDDRPSLRPSQIMQGVREYQRRLDDQGQKLGMICVDYLQLCKSDGSNRFESPRERVSAISSGLREMAASLRVPVIALSQLTRTALKQRSNKRPIPSDLAESGDIESDASLIIAPYREAFYARQEKPEHARVVDDNADEVEMLVLKSRDGSSGRYFKSEFIPSLGRYIPMKDDGF
jgi:replicative DNA helicase